MALIANLKRNRAIKLYIRKLPSLLAKDYGKSNIYTAKQVKKTIERAGLSTINVCYAMAMFSTRETFELYHQQTGESCNYDAMRTDIADKHFRGDCDFTVSDVVSVSSDYGGGFDAGGFDGSGGGDGGGSD